jgi:hypothetical protein
VDLESRSPQLASETGLSGFSSGYRPSAFPAITIRDSVRGRIEQLERLTSNPQHSTRVVVWTLDISLIRVPYYFILLQIPRERSDRWRESDWETTPTDLPPYLRIGNRVCLFHVRHFRRLFATYGK